jgi:hypothetical protein
MKTQKPKSKLTRLTNEKEAKFAKTQKSKTKNQKSKSIEKDSSEKQRTP